MIVHDFQASLERSASYVDAPWWETVYRAAFPSFATMVVMRQDGWAQRGGIDRKIVLASGKTFDIDEKVRERDYPDFCLEYLSDRDRRAPGWVAKDLACDFIAYAFVPSQRCYLLPFPALRKAWHGNGLKWIADYPRIEAQNRDYVTVSVAVPITVVLDAMERAMVLSW